MILVTVGSSLPFDALIEEVDRLAAAGKLPEAAVCQIGHGSYVPKHCEYFRFKPALDDLIDSASLIIGHGGTGTTFQALGAGKPFIAIANPGVADDHQAQFLGRLAQTIPLLWSTTPHDLAELISRATTTSLANMRREGLAADLKSFLLAASRSTP